MITVHASCIAFGRTGVLIRGAPGSGKSALCLSLIDAEGFGLGERPMRAKLVSDDQVCLKVAEGQLIAFPPAPLAGLLEVRGLGIVESVYQTDVPVLLVADLVDPDALERLPDSASFFTTILDIRLACIRLQSRSGLAPARLRTALRLFDLGNSGQTASFSD